MEWSKRQRKLHEHAAQSLTEIMRETFDFIRRESGVSEYKVQQFIYAKLKEKSLYKPDTHPLIVAFGSNSAIPHYAPTKKKSRMLKKSDVIKIDMWARCKERGAPYADITWMGHRGSAPSRKVQELFRLVLKSRNAGLLFLRTNLQKKKLPLLSALHAMTYMPIVKKRYTEQIKHSTGHVLGFTSPHGRGSHIAKRFKAKIKKNVGYTIEPGMYIDGKCGFRSEINFYISSDYKLIVTTPLQKELILV